MRLIAGTLLFTLAVLLNSVELSLQSNDIPPRLPPAVDYRVYYYENENGQLRTLSRHRFNELVRNDEFIYGIYIRGVLRPICDDVERRVVVRIHDNQNMLLTPELAEHLGFHDLDWNPIYHADALALSRRLRNERRNHRSSK